MFIIRQSLKALLFSLFILTSATSTLAAETESDLNSNASQNYDIELLTFRLNQMTFVYYHQLSLTGGAYWAPGVWFFDHRVEGRIQLGTNLIKAKADSLSLFWAPEIQALMGYRFWNKLLLEVGLGTQYWKILDGNFKTLYTAQAHYFFQDKFLSIIDSVYIGYTGISDYQIHSQYRVGLQLRF